MNPEHQFAQALLRAWPFPRGAGRLLDLYFSQLQIDRETAIVKTTDGFDITVLPNELIGRHIYLTGEFDRSIVELLCKFSEPGDVLLDIGANIGYVSTCFLHNVRGSSALAVEPNPELFDLLSTNLNRFGRSRIYPFAISDNDGEAWFEVNRSNMGAGRIVGGCGARTTKIQTRTADSLIKDMSIDHVDLIKIDAEGAEASILKSCAAHFDRLQPKAIIFEDNSKSVAPDGRIGSLLGSIGYTIFGVKKYLRSLSLIKVDQNNSGKFHDYVAISGRRPIPLDAAKTYSLVQL